MMSKVTAKKYLGQHFLTDENIAVKIVNNLCLHCTHIILEVGPGMGVLTKYLIDKPKELFLVEIDKESEIYLKKHYPTLAPSIICKDFLKLDISSVFLDKKISLIGNFPYNISSQILFKVIENRSQIIEVVGMFQKEVAQRIVSLHGNKIYGILSVLLQAFYDTEYLFTVNEKVFYPSPKVKSAVIKLSLRNEQLECDEKMFFKVVKTAFGKRRKTIWNSLKTLGICKSLKTHSFFGKRPEQLSVQEFIELTKMTTEL